MSSFTGVNAGIEIALLGITDVTYSLNEGKVDLLVRQSGKDVLAILTVKYCYYVPTPYSDEIADDFFDIENDEEMYRDCINHIVEEYENRKIPALLISPEYYEFEETLKFNIAIKNAIGNLEAAKKHNKKIKQYYDEMVLSEEDQ